MQQIELSRLEVDCYDCGRVIFIKLPLIKGKANYIKCDKCDNEIQVVLDTFDIISICRVAS